MHSVCFNLLHGIHRISCSCFKRLTGLRSVKQSRLINLVQFQLMENQPKCVCTRAYLLLDAQAESWPETTSLWTGLDVVDVDHLGQASCHCEPDSEHNLNPGNFPRIDVWWVIILHWNGEWPSSGSSVHSCLSHGKQLSAGRVNITCCIFLPIELAIPVGIASRAASYHCASDLPWFPRLLTQTQQSSMYNTNYHVTYNRAVPYIDVRIVNEQL